MNNPIRPPHPALEKTPGGRLTAASRRLLDAYDADMNRYRTEIAKRDARIRALRANLEDAADKYDIATDGIRDDYRTDRERRIEEAAEERGLTNGRSAALDELEGTALEWIEQRIHKLRYLPTDPAPSGLDELEALRAALVEVTS